MFNLQVKDAVPTGQYPFPMQTEAMGERLRRLRVARGLTQERFAKLVGVTKSAVSQWEDGRTKNLKLIPLARALVVLNTDLPYLVWGENRGPDGGEPSLPRRRSGT